ncbi:hypothetical protein CYY_006268 [Polysphondylium violaceum]|uniref:O-acyltransferase n=1 Tax=Polysphondylium violaceum TaxID=133409 RepID=A0A8J4PSI5_9MYCE|nr:hypothetical protein CYY_006268 [Polysphondylium violaceum]
MDVPIFESSPQRHQQQNNNTTMKENNNIKSKERETERVRNRFISHEFHKLDRTQSRINPPKVSDTDSESESEYFLSPSQSNGNNNKSSSTAYDKRSLNGKPGGMTISQRNVSNNTKAISLDEKQQQSVAPAIQSQQHHHHHQTKQSNEKPNLTLNGLFTHRPSLLSSEASGSSYRGFLNLLVLLLITASFRLVILNHLTYGVRIDLNLLKISEYHRWPGVMIGLGINIFIISAYLIEFAASKRIFSDSFCYVLRVLNCAASVIVPSASILAFSPNPASGIIVMIMVCTFSMKIISYHYENSKQRKLNPDNTKFIYNGDTSIYPNNLSLRSTYWFMLVPTLVYQLSYPRSNRIRKGYLARRIFEALFLSSLIFWMVEQYMVPLVQNSVLPMEQYDVARILERIMKLSLPNLYVWLLGFYVFFHLYLNIVAEITRFADREFYRDWWNSTGLDYFWRTWNMPVHHWMVVLIYTPMRRRGFSKNMGYFMCFFVSAIFHELVISIPFHSFKLWGFFGIMSQMVLIALTKGSLNGKNIGNVIFWVTIVLGQPLIVLLYYRNFIQEHPSLYPTTTMMPNSDNH